MASGDDCARGGDTSSSQSLQPSPLLTTTATTARGRRWWSARAERRQGARHTAPPKTLPLGTRPAPPSEVAGPLSPAATVGYVAVGALLLAVSSLRGADGVDDAAVKFLLRADLKEEEEEAGAGG